MVNNSAVLGTSGLHIEYFQRIAASAIRKALVLREQPTPFVLEIEPEEFVRVVKPDASEDGKRKKRKKEPRGPVSVLNIQKTDSGVLLTPSKTPDKNEKKRSNTGGVIQLVSREIPREGPLRIHIRAKALNTSAGISPRLYIALGYDGGNSGEPIQGSNFERYRGN